MSESTAGLPDVQGLEQLLGQDKGQTAPESTDTKAATNEPSKVAPTEPQSQEGQPNLAQFKTPEALLASYKELQGTFTKTSQENKALKEQLDQIQAQFNEQMELMRLSQMNVSHPPQQAPPQDFDQKFIENPQAAVEALAERKAQALIMQTRIQEVLEEENLKNPSEFRERYQYATMISKQYPQLATSRAGVKKLFDMGDKLREQNQKSQAFKAVTTLFGDDVDLEKLRAFVKKDAGQPQNNNLAYMPDSSTSTRTGAELGNPTDYNQQISNAAAQGDVDAVLSGLFKARGLK